MSETGVGARVRRKEDRRHLLGRGQFTSDLRFPGTRDAAFVRSQVGHARIKSITVPPELRSRVILGGDLIGTKPIRAVTDVTGFKSSDYPILATEKVLFVGQPIALCIGDTRAEAEDIAQRVEVEYDELPAISVLAPLRVHPPYLRWVQQNCLPARRRRGAPGVVKGGTAYRP